MGAPIARALWQAKCTVAVCNRTPGRAHALAERCPGITVAPDIATAAAGAQIIILAVKPHLILPTLALAVAAAPHAAIVSLAPGITLDRLRQAGAAAPLRLMPNIAITCGQGMSFICSDPDQAHTAATLADLLRPTGSVAIVEERLFEPAMAVASCGIAFALRYIRATAQAATALGIAPDSAAAYAAATLRGAAALLEATPGTNPEALIDTVTTPGGATIRGLLAMEAAGFTPAVAAAITASASK